MKMKSFLLFFCKVIKHLKDSVIKRIMEASSEQKEIVKNIVNYNVIVDAVAGSGKTTTVLHISKEYKLNILLLTYNKKLRLETKKKRDALAITNLEIHTYHSFCVRHLGMKGYTDYEIRDLLSKPIDIKENLYDIIIIDEAQDLTELYYRLVCEIIKASASAKLCIMGDRYQSIYKFNKADERYIIFADELFKFNKYEWKRGTLSISYRMTKNMTEFINKCVLGTNRINSIKENGPKVKYFKINTFRSGYILENIIGVNSKDFKKEDIFILAPSVKRKGKTPSPVIRIANELTKMNIPIYIPNTDDEVLDEDILKGKIVFSTFHQAKGLERKKVIVFNFDDSYFKYYEKEADPNVCPNTIYVAITRAIENLIVINHEQNGFLPFLKHELLTEITEVYPSLDSKKPFERTNKTISEMSITGLIEHISSDVLYEAYNYFTIELMNDKKEFINILTKTKQDDLYESVSDITGIAIPAYFELVKKGKMTIRDCINGNRIAINEELKKHKIDGYHDIGSTVNPQDLLKTANLYNAWSSKCYFKLSQIKHFDWLSQENLNSGIERLSKRISDKAEFEFKIEGNVRGIDITGRIDCLDTTGIWEFKTTRELTKEHFIQLACYAYLYETTQCEVQLRRNYYLYNILSDETYQINFDLKDLKTMMELLIDQKIGKCTNTTDDAFKDRAKDLTKTSSKKISKFDPSEFDF
jgi:hypothetical protein